MAFGEGQLPGEVPRHHCVRSFNPDSVEAREGDRLAPSARVLYRAGFKRPHLIRIGMGLTVNRFCIYNLENNIHKTPIWAQ